MTFNKGDKSSLFKTEFRKRRDGGEKSQIKAASCMVHGEMKAVDRSDLNIHCEPNRNT